MGEHNEVEVVGNSICGIGEIISRFVYIAFYIAGEQHGGYYIGCIFLLLHFVVYYGHG